MPDSAYHINFLSLLCEIQRLLLHSNLRSIFRRWFSQEKVSRSPSSGD
jgi:hypothetical protein